MQTNRRWIYLITGAFLLLFLGLIYAWSIFKAPFMEFYPEWTVSQLSMTFTISMICFCLGGFVGGQLNKKLQPMYILWISAVMLFVGFFGVSTIVRFTAGTSLYLLYIFYGVLCGGGVGIGYNCVISTVNKWFADRAGTASGILLMGFGLGGLVFGGLVNILISNMGLFPTFKTLAILVSIIIVIGSLILKSPQANNEKMEMKYDIKSYKTKEMVSDARFWIFIIWTVLLNSAGLLVINSGATIALAFGAPALLGLLVSVFNGCGRVVLGGMFDKHKRKRTLFTNTMIVLCAGIILALGAITGQMGFILIGLLITGLGYGGMPAITSAYIHSEFGPKHFPVNFSVAMFSLIPAAIIGPLISSQLIESAEGSYTSTFIMIIILALAGAVLWQLLNTASVKREQSHQRIVKIPSQCSHRR